MTTRGRRTIADIQRRWTEADRGSRRTLAPTVVASPAEAGVVAVASKLEGCLTHLVRYATTHHPDWRASHRVFECQCGYSFAEDKVDIIDPTGELFACARCIAVAEKAGEPTFNLVPSTGCEVSEGKRGGRALRRRRSQ